MSNLPLRSELTSSYREKYVAEFFLGLRLGDCDIQVKTNSNELLSKLEDYFEPFVVQDCAPKIVISAHEADSPHFDFEFTTKQPDPGKVKIKEEFVNLQDGRIVRKRLTGMVFVFGEGDNLAIGPCLANDNQVINFVNNRFIEYKLMQGCLLGHAAAVMHQERGMSMAGFSGMGKSTLALHLMSRGTTFISNDRIMVEQENEELLMHGVAKLPRINPGTALNNPDLASILSPEDKEKFSQLPADELWQLEHKYDVPIDDCFGPDKFILSAPMQGLALLNWKRDGSPLQINKVNLAERKDLLPAFMKSTGLFFLPGKDAELDFSEQAYIDVLSKCTVIEFSGGVDFDKAADTCLRFLQGQEI